MFLSGNGPLVKVLQHALRSSIFVQAVHGFLKQYGGTKERLPAEHIWVYDEAQRAWDSERVREKRGHDASEPEDFTRLGARGPWAMMVGLIGEGQEIYVGEEAGLIQWNDAIAKSRAQWHVHCPTKVANVFTAAHSLHTVDALDLTTWLRSHLAQDTQTWTAQLLKGKLADAAATARMIAGQGFDLYMTSDFNRAADYVRRRYECQVEKRYGLLASSLAKNVAACGFRNDFMDKIREGPWYNDSPDSTHSCCRLDSVATEFAWQGLELDFPIVAWGSDLTWSGTGWVSPPQPRSTAHDPHRLRVNSYRVLLSRGRDGMIIFVPPTEQMDSTRQALEAAGVQEL